MTAVTDFINDGPVLPRLALAAGLIALLVALGYYVNQYLNWERWDDDNDLPEPPAELCRQHAAPFVEAIQTAPLGQLRRVATRSRIAVESDLVDDRLCGLGGPPDHPIAMDRDAIFDAVQKRCRYGFTRSDKIYIDGAFNEVCVAMNAPASMLDPEFLRAIWYVVEPVMGRDASRETSAT